MAFLYLKCLSGLLKNVELSITFFKINFFSTYQDFRFIEVPLYMGLL